MTNPLGTLKGNHAIELFLLGKEAWNQWAKQHPGWAVDFSQIKLGNAHYPKEFSFDSYIFPGPVNFKGVNFDYKNVSFQSAIFQGGDISFAWANFDGDVTFSGATFGDGNKLFTGATFRDSRSLPPEAEDENMPVRFDNVDFGAGTVDFSRVSAHKSITFENSIFRIGSSNFTKLKIKSNLSFTSTRFITTEIDFSEMEVSNGNADFSKSIFMDSELKLNNCKVKSNGLDFDDAKFYDTDASFDTVSVKIDILFRKVIFNNGMIWFPDLDCGNDVCLDDSKFSDSDFISFNGIKVGHTLTLDRTSFSVVPDLRNSIIDRDVSMTNMKVDYKKQSRFCNWAKGPEHSDMYRKLKSLAIQANDHQKEIDFFAMEEKAKEVWHYSPMRFIPSYLYGLFSDFGRSIWRPTTGLATTGVGAAFGFQWVQSGSFGFPKTSAWFQSLLHLLPFVPGSRGSRIEELCKANKSGTDAISDCIDLMERVAFGESFLAIFFIFLIGLALRNRFRL